MSLADHVQLNITVDTVGIARAGFGVPLYLSHNATWPERVRFYTTLSEVAADFPVTTSPEYLFAAATTKQSPRVSRFAIGRAALKPTQAYQVSVSTVRNSYKYQLRVAGQGVTATTVEFTSDASATDGEIAAGLVTALNAVVGRNFTAAGAASPITITGNAAGNWFSVEVVNVDDLSIAQTHADPGVATDLAAIALAEPGWYGLVTAYNSSAYVAAAAAWVESDGRLYGPSVCDTASITGAVGAGGTLDALATAGYTRSFGWYHPSPAAMLDAAFFGRWLSYEPGAATAKFKTLVGVTPAIMTATHKANLRAKRANSYETVAGRAITFDGTVPSTQYRFVDVRRDVDWLDDEIRKAVYGTLAVADKVPYTAEGIAQIANVLRGALELGVRKGVLVESSIAVVEPNIVDVQPADKAARNLTGLRFAAALQGAVHSAIPINGSISF